MSYGSDGNMPPILRNVSANAGSSRFAALSALTGHASKQREALKGFFDRRAPRQGSVSSASERLSWKDWAGEKIRNRRGSSWNNGAVEKVSLFPGWASRKYDSSELEGKEAAAFSVEVFVSGFAASYIPPENATRSQRAFMRLARAFAALPKIPMPDPLRPSSSASPFETNELPEDILRDMKLPPTPSEITEASEIQALEKEFCRGEADIDSISSLSSDSSGAAPRAITPSDMLSLPSTPIPQITYETTSAQFVKSPADLTKLQANLDERLRPFWSRSIPNRLVRLKVYTRAPRASEFLPSENSTEDSRKALLYSHEITTDPQGSFEVKIQIPWDRLSAQDAPSDTIQIAYGDSREEYELFVEAELLPPPNGTVTPNMITTPCDPIVRSVITIPITQSRVRLISDIDDTIKISNILGGARAVFQNVFVKHLEELVIKGMEEWYTGMWSRGVRFHYVSNGPFQLLPVINEFIRVSNLPRGSIKLRSYAGRSLFNGLLSAPATRKRAGIIDILDAFNGSRFFLVGDSGEQDLELYSQIASERHHQILAIFVRDARGPTAPSLDDPTGDQIKRVPLVLRSRQSTITPGVLNSEIPANDRVSGLSPSTEWPTPTQESVASIPTIRRRFTQPILNGLSESSRMKKRPQPRSSLSVYASQITAEPSPSPTSSSSSSSSPPIAPSNDRNDIPEPMTPQERRYTISPQFPGSMSRSDVAALPPDMRRKYELQERIYKARLLIPDHIPLRVFKEPGECVEAYRKLDDIDQRGRAT